MRIINHIWIEGKKMNILNCKRTLKDSIEHQGIGGKEIVIEKGIIMVKLVLWVI